MENNGKNTILFTLLCNDEAYQIQTKREQYFSLMSLIADHVHIAGFGLCSGMGSCGTCMVTIDGIPTLSCAIPVNDALANTEIKVENTTFGS